MNKIRVKQKDKIRFKDIPTGTVFAARGDILIKVSRIDILSLIDFEKRERECTIDIETLPNAVCLSSGAMAYFSLDEKVTAIYPSATISIE